MIIFAFPGTGKTTLAHQYTHVVELEISEIKYDNSSVSHLSKEARKAIRRPIKTKNYRKVYVNEALRLHAEGKMVLVALNFLLPVLWGLWKQQDSNFRIYLPQYNLREEYRQRYLKRGNNAKFIREVMWIWGPTVLFFKLLAICFPAYIIFLGSGEFLKDKLRDQVREAEWLGLHTEKMAGKY